MFDPLPLDKDKHTRVPEEPIIGSFIPVQREGEDHAFCTQRNGQWYDSTGFVCSRCTHKKGIIL